MNKLTELIKNDMKPALGVTEPGAIAYAVAMARNHASGRIEQVTLRLNSGMFKNAFTCGIPGIREVGNEYAAALGAVAANPAKGLECLAGITEAEKVEAKAMAESGKITVEIQEITSRIFIEAAVTTAEGNAVVTIQDAHTNIVKITENGSTIFEKEQETAKKKEDGHLIYQYTLEQLYTYADTVPVEEIEFIKDAFTMNQELMLEGLDSDRTTYAPFLLEANGGKLLSADERKTASLFCNAAIEARVIGLSRPAMSITGSGAHGIIATMPLYAVTKVNDYSEETLLRATALSYLVCMYIKEYSGKLSAFCGCAIAAGTGMACGLVFLRGGKTEQMTKTIQNMASSITGMLCDGGNQGCTMKGIVAVDAAFASVNMAMKDVYINNVHGINGKTPEETMRNMGLIASPGMIGTEKTIIDILDEKGKRFR